MLIAIISWITVGLLLATSAGLLISPDWRWSLGLMAIQYIGVFWLVRLHWPTAMAAAKLVTGWMVIAALGITHLSIARSETSEDEAWPGGRLFRLFAGGIVVAIVAAVTPRVPKVLPGIGLPETAGSLLLIGMGLLHLGITGRPLRVILGLLTVLAGFETLYAALEGSALVAALLAGINLALALVGSYLLIMPQSEATE
jgi:hypothetical protein